MDRNPDFTWIDVPASSLIDGAGVVPLNHYNMKPDVFGRICELAGRGDPYWWRYSDQAESLGSRRGPFEWGWCFETPNGFEWQFDWVIGMWFRDPKKAMLVKLAL